MNFTRTKIADVIEIIPSVFEDERGYFMESFHHEKFETFLGEKINFCQENESFSKKNVLRGLHFQTPPFAQSKLVRVLSGKILDVAVDIRKDSATYGMHIAVELSSENKKQLFIPQGFAHGFIVLSDTAKISYKVDNYYSPDNDSGIYFADEKLGIDWGEKIENVIISDKDKKLELLSELL